MPGGHIEFILDDNNENNFSVDTLEGIASCHTGDWIAKGVENEAPNATGITASGNITAPAIAPIVSITPAVLTPPPTSIGNTTSGLSYRRILSHYLRYSHIITSHNHPEYRFYIQTCIKFANMVCEYRYCTIFAPLKINSY
jgi:hypothetical protein